jgi:renal tumor antigen
MQHYKIISKKGEGTFSEVMKALHITSGRFYAIKCMKRSFQSVEDVNKLQEIRALRILRGHPHIVQLREVLFDNRRLSIVFELLEMNVYEAIKDRDSLLPEWRVTRWMHELLQAIGYMHKQGIFHRDVKPENLLLIGDVLKLADLGSCCSISNKAPLTEYISTRWYRAPECLLTSGFYSSKMDLWAAGCVYYELITLNPLFPGKNELDQINRIHATLGTPNESILAEFRQSADNHLREIRFSPVRGSGFSQNLNQCSIDTINVIGELLIYDPSRRPTASRILRHRVFQSLRDSRKDSPTTATSSPREQIETLSSHIPKLALPPKFLGVSNSLNTAKQGFSSTLHPKANFSNPYFKASPRSRSQFLLPSPKVTARPRFVSKPPNPLSSVSFLLASARRAHA